ILKNFLVFCRRLLLSLAMHKKEKDRILLMEESFLLKSAVVLGIMGVIVLYIISGNLKVDESSISRITFGQEGSIIIRGKVVNSREYNNSFVFDIESKETIPVIVLKKNKNYAELIRQNDSVEVKGKIKANQNRKQIIADEVRVI
ncbi:MAG: OB-fold nucleic acid binding domain-containing protein, partial [Candidatus Woesearchaeota archaeon]|nr:OB-fold nucleic acid binding domain-containing protein [Candidatus Woesearchaeota archaeon]